MLLKFKCDRCGGEWAVGMPPDAAPSEETRRALAECPYCPAEGGAA